MERAEAVGAGMAIISPLRPEDPLVPSSTYEQSIEGSRRATTNEVEKEVSEDYAGPDNKNVDIESTTPMPILQPTISTSVEPSAPTPVKRPLSPFHLVVVAALVTFTLCMSAAGSMTLTIALPTIQTELGMDEHDLQWITAAYGLTNGCFLLLSGRLADVHGRKLVFLVGLTWAGIWTLVGGFMKDGAALVVTRALAGSGAAMSTPSAIGIIASNFQGKARSTAFAAFSAGAPVGGGIGLVLGGVLTAYSPYTWRACLWTLASLTFAIALAAFFFVPPDGVSTVDKRVDWVGAALVTVGLIFLQFVISDALNAPNGWMTWYILFLLILGIFFVGGFFFWEHYVQTKTTRPPLMRLQLWTRAKGRLASVYVIGFVTWMGFTSLFFHATLFYQEVQGYDAIQAMLRFLPTAVSGILCNVLVAYLIAIVPTQWIICTGLLATGLASVLFAVSPADVIYWRMPFNAMWMAVLGADFLMATGSIFVAALALPEEQSVAGAVFQTLVQLGGSFGLAFTTVVNQAISSRSTEQGKSADVARLDGLHAAFWLGAACSFAALILALVMLRGMGAIGKFKKAEAAKTTGPASEAVTGPERVPTGSPSRTIGQEKV